MHSTYEADLTVNDSLNRSHFSAIEEARSEHRIRERELENRLERVTNEDSALF